MNRLKSFNQKLQESITAESETREITVLAPLTIEEQYLVIHAVLGTLERQGINGQYPNYAPKDIDISRMNGSAVVTAFRRVDQTDAKTAIVNAGRTLYELITQKDGIGPLTPFKSPYWPIIEVMGTNMATQDIGKLTQALERAYTHHERRTHFWRNGAKKLHDTSAQGIGALGIFGVKALRAVWDYWFAVPLIAGVAGAVFFINAGWYLWDSAAGHFVFINFLCATLMIILQLGSGNLMNEHSTWSHRNVLHMNLVSTVCAALWLAFNCFIAGILHVHYTHPPFIYERSTGAYVGRAVQSEKDTSEWHITGINKKRVDLVKYRAIVGFPLEGTVEFTGNPRMNRTIAVRYSIGEEFVKHPSKDYAALDPAGAIKHALQEPLALYGVRYVDEASKRTYILDTKVHGIDLWESDPREIDALREAEKKIFLEGAMRTITSVKLPEPWTTSASLSIRGLIQ